ncbi:Pyridoxine 5'-phosphate synthase [Botrimarina colliarenosi]|uniref:Pyridoxine 5'-phosphate synthase n=1 Tax=Botrimarina colliarenosi TaxID=2528001 RepID=A0A5C6A233_9BACT|nr:pyridoxine 5'-phosphate synthase [Botrimarina colliarenosi]TWT93400.1 Pyridoxine 5'-phosphate synthase [Botrimarina colliarenosi]
MASLGVNIDHVATVRQARRTTEPDPATAAALAVLAGADGITIHLREDRRHIQDRDLEVLMQTAAVPVNLECACTDEMIGIACATKPHQVTLVPERREEVTTEGGLDIVGGRDRVGTCVERLAAAGILVSLFIDADPAQIEASASLGEGVDGVELHTGPYAHAFADAGGLRGPGKQQLERLVSAGAAARAAGLRLHAGHGLNYQNVQPVAALPEMSELNIGHSIVSRAVLVGFEAAVREMKRLIVEAKS